MTDKERLKFIVANRLRVSEVRAYKVRIGFVTEFHIDNDGDFVCAGKTYRQAIDEAIRINDVMGGL